MRTLNELCREVYYEALLYMVNYIYFREHKIAYTMHEIALDMMLEGRY